MTYKAILTFDDGPIGDESSPAGTGDKTLTRIINTLKTHNATGVFYVTGQEVKWRPELAKMIVEEGHIIQNHSWRHDKLSLLDKEKIKKDLKDTQEVIFKATGKTPDRIRPPYGAGWVGEQSKPLIAAARELNLKLTGWDIDTNDWDKNNSGLDPRYFVPKRNTWEKLYNDTKQPLDILMHVKSKTSVALAKFMDGLKSMKWEFTVYPESAQSSTETKYWLQIFAGSEKGANEQALKASTLGYSHWTVVKEGTQYKVRIGPFDSKSDAVVFQKNFNGSFVVTHTP